MKKACNVYLWGVVMLFLFCNLVSAQTLSKRSDHIDNIQAEKELIAEQDNNTTEPEKTLAKHGKSTYILQKHTPNISLSAVETYDFTTGSDKYYQFEGESGAKDLGDGNWGMIAGDPNGSGVVNGTDFYSVKNGIGSTGYNNADCNMSGVVNGTDYYMIKNNIGAQSPVDN